MKKKNTALNGFTLILGKIQGYTNLIAGEEVFDQLPVILQEESDFGLIRHFKQRMSEFAFSIKGDCFVMGCLTFSHSTSLISDGPSHEMHIDHFDGEIKNSTRLTIPYDSAGTIFALLNNEQRILIDQNITNTKNYSLVNGVQIDFNCLKSCFGDVDIPYIQVPEGCMGMHLRGRENGQIGALHGEPNFIGSRSLGAIEEVSRESAYGRAETEKARNLLLLSELRNYVLSTE